ncbi:hypothetical protein HanPSC8_Chr12g0505241 [Helianthus annuus]|nr:hypothetical protein HanPSC8_Chr12g0505241 [Helianthus annuus]
MHKREIDIERGGGGEREREIISIRVRVCMSKESLPKWELKNLNRTSVTRRWCFATSNKQLKSKWQV